MGKRVWDCWAAGLHGGSESQRTVKDSDSPHCTGLQASAGVTPSAAESFPNQFASVGNLSQLVNGHLDVNPGSLVHQRAKKLLLLPRLPEVDSSSHLPPPGATTADDPNSILAHSSSVAGSVLHPSISLAIECSRVQRNSSQRVIQCYNIQRKKSRKPVEAPKIKRVRARHLHRGPSLCLHPPSLSMRTTRDRADS